MGMWPFRRKSQRRRGAGGSEPLQPEMQNAGIQQDPACLDGTQFSKISSAGLVGRKSRRDTKRKASKETKKLQRDPGKRDKTRTYSFSPVRHDSIRITDRPPVPAFPGSWKGKGRASTATQSPRLAASKPNRASTQPFEDTQNPQRMPTLQKRSAKEMARRKSSKKRKGEHSREAEMKAMSEFLPTRPAADFYSHGRSMKRQRDPNHPSSDVSLPLAESLSSSFSGHSQPQQTNIVVSTLEMLAPRPTLRYSENPRHNPGASGWNSPPGSQRRPNRPPIGKETLKAHKRVDSLADDLDAAELREIMEREQKRREKRKIAEQIKTERRLARRQERQTSDEFEAARNGTPPPVNMDRGVFGREIVGLGIETSAATTPNKRKSSGSEHGRGKRPAGFFRQDSTTSAVEEGFYRSESLVSDTHTPDVEQPGPIFETATVGTIAKASISPALPAKGHTRGRSSISQMLDLSQSEAPEPSRLPEPTPTPVSQPAATAPVKTPSSWSSFFKLRGTKNKRSTPPSSFSNTSRDSVLATQARQASTSSTGYTPMRSMSNVPKRTMSKFREDLPELPISPPDSRVQSPEVDVVDPVLTGKKVGHRIHPEDPAVRYDTPTSGHRSIGPSPELATVMSQSLASIDSEGSWLTGKRMGSQRGSSQLAQHPPMQDSPASLKNFKAFNQSSEEVGTAEDEYFSRMTPGPDEENMINRLSGIDDEDTRSVSSPVPSENTKWGALGRQPTVVHRASKTKSREGLLLQFEDADDDLESEDASAPSSPTDPKFEGELQRAKSVDLGKTHARHISAGSARLLDLKRSSVDSRRSSSARLSVTN